MIDLEQKTVNNETFMPRLSDNYRIIIYQGAYLTWSFQTLARHSKTTQYTHQELHFQGLIVFVSFQTIHRNPELHIINRVRGLSEGDIQARSVRSRSGHRFISGTVPQVRWDVARQDSKIHCWWSWCSNSVSNSLISKFTGIHRTWSRKGENACSQHAGDFYLDG